MTTLQHIIARTVRTFKGGDGLPELADRLGICLSMLYRISNPLDEGASLNTKHLVPLMEATRDYSILKHLAARCGFGLYRVPRVRTAREEEVAEYQQRQAEAIRAVVGVFHGHREPQEGLDAIRNEMDKAAGFLKAIETRATPSLFEE